MCSFEMWAGPHDMPCYPRVRLDCRLNIGSPDGRARAPLTSGRRPPDHDKIDRPTRSVIIENPDRQPSRPPGERVQIGAAFIQQRTFGMIIVTMDDVECAETVIKFLRIALPQECRLALPTQGNSGIDAGVNVEAMCVDMHQPQSIEPIDMG